MFKWFGWVNLSPCTKVGEFAAHLRDGRLMASKCRRCGRRSFPPRADCEGCLSGEFELVEIGGRGRLHTWTRIDAAPAGFESLAPYVVGVVDLEEGGRALAWIGASLPESALRAGLEMVLVPRLHEDVEDIRVDYTLELPGAAGSRPAVAGGAAGAAAAVDRGGRS